MSKYKFKKTDGGAIDANKGKEWIKKWDDKHKGAVRAYFFGTDIIESILHQEGAVGMRIYLGYGDEKDPATGQDRVQMVLVGAREDGSNIWPDAVGKDKPGGTVADNGYPCPPYC